MKKIRQKRTMFTFFILAYLLIVVLSTLYRYSAERGRLDEIVRARLQNGAALVKYVLPHAYFDRATDSISITQSEYDNHVRMLSHAAWENNFRNLYALKEYEGAFYYIAQSVSKKDVADKRSALYWKECRNISAGLTKAFRNHKIVYAKNSDKTGAFYTVYLPEYSPSGQLYIAAADIDYRDYKMALNSILNEAVLQALILLLLLFLIYFTLSRMQKHYIRKLQFSNTVNEDSPIGVMSLQPNGKIDYVNSKFAGLIGLDVENLDGKNINTDLGFNKKDELINRIRICLQRQISWQGEFLNAAFGNREFWVNANINYILPAEHGKAMVNVFAADVTSQMKSRISLGQHNKVLNYLSQAIHSLLASPDISKSLPEVLSRYGQNLAKSQVTILKKNLYTYEIFASWLNPSALDSAISISMFSRISKPVFTNWEDDLQRRKIVSGETYDFPMSLITMARICNPGIMHLCPIFCDELFWGFMLTLQTQRTDLMDEELEHTLMNSLADSIGSAINRSETDLELRKSIDVKTGFMSSMSHEIRTPLNGILGMVNLMEQTPLTETQKDYLEAMKSSGRMLINLINNILDITRIEAGKTLLRNDPVALVSCIKAAVNIINYELKEKKLSLELIFDPNLPSVVQGDETRIKQIIVNLLHNAIKFTDRGKIRLAAERKGKNWVKFIISDTGVGMSHEQLQHIFEPFYQAGPLAQRIKGTGLGLSISKQLVELMDGKIRAESEPGRGTTIEFNLALPVLDDVLDYNGQDIVSSINYQEDICPPLALLQTLFLPGNDLDDKVLQNFLQSRGCKYDTAESWTELMFRLREEDITLAIVNLNYAEPEHSRQKDIIIKAAQETPEKHWLILTSETTKEISSAGNPAENITCLPKPLNFELTLQCLQRVLTENSVSQADNCTVERLDKH